MKHKFLSLTLLGAMASTLFLSCQNEEEPITPPHNGLNNNELVEYSISVNVPDEMRTRARELGTIGESGLFEYPTKTINRLRYAIYNEETLLTSNTKTRSGSDPFKITFSLENYVNPTNIYLFFWADNSSDQCFNVDFKKKVVSTNYNTNMGDNYMSPWDLGYKDSFTGYFQFAESAKDVNRSKSFTLKRPFAEIHILTDEIYKTNITEYFDRGTRSYIGFGDDIATYSNCKTQLYKPEKWHYDTSDDSGYEKNDFEFRQFPCLTGTSYQEYYPPFINTFDGTYSTEFKGRDMEYIGCFFVFVPENGSSFKYINEEQTKQLDKINIAVNKNGYNFRDGLVKFITLDFPEGGLKANHKYIYYNKPFENGGTGFFDGGFSYEILVDHDNQFEEPDTETEVNT